MLSKKSGFLRVLTGKAYKAKTPATLAIAGV